MGLKYTETEYVTKCKNDVVKIETIFGFCRPEIFIIIKKCYYKSLGKFTIREKSLLNSVAYSFWYSIFFGLLKIMQIIQTLSKSRIVWSSMNVVSTFAWENVKESDESFLFQ